jgi:hypothetical protein
MRSLHALSDSRSIAGRLLSLARGFDSIFVAGTNRKRKGEMADYREVVTGRIVDRKAGQPIAGARVEVFDEDMLLDDYLGAAVTDREGRFEVEFTTSEYKDGPFDGRPDIFLEVRNPTTGKQTKSKVFRKLTGELADDDSVEMMDLGDTAID